MLTMSRGKAVPPLLFALALTAVVAPSSPTRAVGISTLTEDGAWSWFSDPRAFCVGDVVYAGWVTTLGDIQAGAYDLLDGDTFAFDLEVEFGADDHNYPAFCQTSDGHYTAFYSGHAVDNTCGLFRTALYPDDITCWGPRDSTGIYVPGSGGTTYSNPYQVPGETDEYYLFWRGGDWKPNYAVGTYDPGTRLWLWQHKGQLITTTFGRPYVKYAHGGDRIGLAFTDGHPKDTPSNIYYAEIARLGANDMAYYRADGTLIKPLNYGGLEPCEADTVFNRLADPEMTGDNSWIWDVAFDDEGRPVVAFASFPSLSNHQYHWARYEGGVWNDEILVADAGGSVADTTLGNPQYYYSGGIALDPLDPSTTYVSITNILGGSDLEMRVRHPDGTWTSECIMGGTDADNMRPVVPRSRPDDTRMVAWMSGRYDYFKNTPLLFGRVTRDSVYVGLPLPECASSRDDGSDHIYYETTVKLWVDPVVTSVSDQLEVSSLKLHAPRPNPFTAHSEIHYSLGRSGHVTVRIYDVAGRLVRTLIDEAVSAGLRTTVWDGLDDRGVRASSGVYFVRAEFQGAAENRRVVLVR